MKQRVRIPREIVIKYENSICFMVNKDECLMEAIEPWMSLIMLMVYEVDAQNLETYAQHLLNALVDSNDARFGTYK